MRISSLANRILIPAMLVIVFGIFSGGRASAQLGSRAPGTSASQAATFTVEPSFTYAGAAHVANGASLRNVGSATIRLRGMPSDTKVIQAWLYWDFTSLTSPTYAQSTVIFGKGGRCLAPRLMGTLIGSGADACWFGGSNFAYRADVTKFVSGNGDYLVTLEPGAANTTNGSNPWSSSSPANGPLAEGASIVAIYTSSIEATLHRSGL